MSVAAMGSNNQAGLKEWMGLSVLALPALLISIDVSVMILALPHIGVGLGADSTQQLWIMDIYGFMLSGFLITMGTLGDRIGRRKLLIIGGAAFGIASLIAAFSSSVGMLITARALLGIAGATISPCAMALISNMFHDHKQRSLAFGIWFMCFFGGMALGPVVGGALLEHFPWGSIFLLAVPVMLLLLVTAPYLLPEYRDPASGRIDLISVVLSFGAILPFIYGLKEIAKQGLQIIPLLAVTVGVAIGAVFVSRQRSLANPLIDLRLFANPAFSTALGSMFGVTLTGACMLFIAQHLQLVQGMSPLSAALWMLPGVVASMAGMLLSPLIARRIRPALLIGVGHTIAATGCVMLAQVGVVSGLAYLVIGYILFSLGGAPLPSLSSDIIIGSAPSEKAGSAASLLQTSGEFAFAVGIAVLGSIGTYIYRIQIGGFITSDMTDSAAMLSRESLSGAITAAQSLPESIRSSFLRGAYESFTSGMHAVAAISGGIMLCIAILTIIKLRHIRPVGQKATNEDNLLIHE